MSLNSVVVVVVGRCLLRLQDMGPGQSETGICDQLEGRYILCWHCGTGGASHSMFVWDPD